MSAEATVGQWSERFGTEVPPVSLRKHQRTWDEAVLKKRFANMLNEATQPDKARLRAVSSPYASSWLQALPVPTVGNLLDDDVLRISVALRLGAPVCQQHQCKCGERVDELGTHGLSCRYSAGRHSRHSSLNEVVKRALGSIGVPTVLEPRDLTRTDGKRPDGKSLIPWSNGKPLVWDVTVTDTLASTYVSASSQNAGSAAAAAETRKITKYSHLSTNYNFIPIALETFGAWGKDTEELFSEIERRIRLNSGEPKTMEFLRQRISIELQRGNAASVLGTLPTRDSFDNVFHYYLFKESHAQYLI